MVPETSDKSIDERQFKLLDSTRTILREIIEISASQYLNEFEDTDTRLVSLLSNLRNELASNIAFEFRLQKKTLNTVIKREQQEAEGIADAFIAAFPDLLRSLSDDAEAVFRNDPSAKSMELIFLCYPGFSAIRAYRIAHQLQNLGLTLIPRIMTEIAHAETGIDIHPGATIGRRLVIEHGTGTVIGETTQIGNDVVLYQGVTLGTKRHFKNEKQLVSHESKKLHPTIENKVILFDHTTVLGGKTVIGENSIIGPSVLITESVPRGSIIAPAQSLSSRHFESLDNPGIDINKSNIAHNRKELYNVHLNSHFLPVLPALSHSPESPHHPLPPEPLTPASVLRQAAQKAIEARLSWSEISDAVFGTMAADFETLKGQAMAASHGVRQALAKRLEPVLNAQIQTMPRGTLEEKKALCDFVNGTLEPLGLAVKCPKTDQPAQIKADVGSWPSIGRYQFQFQRDKKTVRSASTDELPNFVVVDAFPLKELETSFQDKVGPKTKRSGRKLGE